MATPTKSQHRYELIVYWSEADASFVVEVPELAGCMADGVSHAEAVAAAELVTVVRRFPNALFGCGCAAKVVACCS